MEHHVFISYSRHDSDLMARIRDDLRAADLLVWTDDSLTPGTDSWKNAIENAIQNAGSVVVLMSPDSKQSIWVEREMDYARACKVPIIPVLARGENEVSAIPFELINAQRVDLREDYALGYCVAHSWASGPVRPARRPATPGGAAPCFAAAGGR